MNTAQQLFGPKPVIPAVQIPDAEQQLRQGLAYFCGPAYSWLPAYNLVAAWAANNHNKGLLLSGDYGTGKTLLTCRILLPLINHYWQQTHLGSPHYFLSRFSAVDMPSASKCPANLIIDDLGAEDITSDYGTRINYFALLVDKAEFEGRLLICTTNLTPQQLRAKYGLRAWDRLSALTTPVVFNNNGQSLR